ncbi:MAG: Do family serine endopeptidase [Pseudomonadota bacterium]|nr:Do family serine endopeptidase [Pseudomonadota bacterium]
MVYRFISIAVLVLGTSVALVAHAALPLVLPGGAGEADVALPSLADMLERTNPAVVNIATRTTVVERNRLLADPFFRRFFNIPESRRRYRRTQSAGSGVVVDADLGYIVTNNHVVDGADEISVGLSDGRTLEAELVGRDPQVDLALLKVSAENLVAIEFADSAALRVGDFVVAIGNPFGLNQTVTSGIVSALGRSGLGIEGYEDFIQTDAPINPGNSGGALVDLRGELVGINTAIYAPSGGNVGIGFAIPANMAAAIIDELVENGEVNRGYVGAVVQPLNRELAKAFDVLPADGAPAGVVIVDVQPASSAEKAGLAPGDVIVQMGDKKITSVADFENQAAVMFIGDRLDIVFVRQGQQQTLTLEIFADTQEQVAGQRITPQLSGVALQNLSAADDFGGGVLVAEINRGSTAYAYGLRAGDIIVSANRRTVVDIAELREAVRRDNRRLTLRVYRNGRFGPITIPAS